MAQRSLSFDRIVLDAITTLRVHGHIKYITPTMIFHVIAGRNNKLASKNYANEINNSIIKMMFTHVVTKMLEENDRLEDFNLLPANMVKAKLNGFETNCMYLYGRLPLYSYAKIHNQICILNLEIIRKPFEQNKKENKEQMEILYYLIRKILTLSNTNTSIKYEILYHDLGYDDATSINKFKLRRRIKAILNALKNSVLGNRTLIDYQEMKKGSAPYQIDINYKTTKRQKPYV